MKKITTMVAAVCLLFSVVLNAHAIINPDPQGKGILTLLMEWKEEKLDSGTLTICRVGQIVNKGTKWTFAPVTQLQDSGISLEDPNDAQLANQLVQLVKEKELPCVTEPIRKGKAFFLNLDAGLYLVRQDEACDGFYPINPFLISVPRWEDDGYVYALTARPKVSLEPTEPDETKPTEPDETKPTEPDETNPTEPDETKPTESKPTEPRPTESKPTEPKPTETEPEKPKPTLPVGSVLPQTGQLNWPVPVMAAAGLSLLVLGWYLNRGKKNGHES